jgi:hypothetical protein
MKKYKYIYIILIFFISLLIITGSFALYKSAGSSDLSVELADWHVSLIDLSSEQSDDVNITSGVEPTAYRLAVESLSDVTIKYNIKFTGLPSGVQVSIDDSPYVPESNGIITFNSRGRINVDDIEKTKEHIIKFKAPLGTTEISNKLVNIDVQFEQVI